MDNPEAALKTARTMSSEFSSFLPSPIGAGRLGCEEGIQELVMAPLPYIATYCVKESSIDILNIWHGAQDR